MPTMLFETPETKLDRIDAYHKWEDSLPPETPEEREMAIYEAIYVDFQKPRKVAQTFNIAPATAENIARQVRDRLARREHEFYQLRKLDALVERRAIYVSMFRELREAWTVSKEGRSTVHASSGVGEPLRETIRNRGLGDVRYMHLMLRVRKELDALEERLGEEEANRNPKRERGAQESRSPPAASPERQRREKRRGMGGMARGACARKLPSLTRGARTCRVT